MIKKIVIFLVSLTVLLSIHSCADSPTTDETASPGEKTSANPKTASSGEETLSSKQPFVATAPIATQQNTATVAINAFAANLYAQLSQPADNLFFSPYSVSTALAMTYAGAKGDTKIQMAKALQFKTNEPAIQRGFSELQKSFNNADSSYQLKVANSIWVQKQMTLFAEFTEKLYDFYRIVARTADFENATDTARRHINAEIAKQTEGKIQDLLAPNLLSSETRLVLTNAIYFKGKWQIPFNPEKTKELIFVKLDGSQIKIPTMYQKEEFRLWEDEKVQLIELPYQTSEKGAALSMFILLPRQNENFALIDKKLPDYLLKSGKELSELSEIAVYLPKFKTESTLRLQEPLKTLGMINAFDSSADFSGMTDKEKLRISAVVQKSFIEVNEEGTEAAAATAVVASRGRTPVFRADHPFIFWIKDNRSGTILFLGKIVEPM